MPRVATLLCLVSAVLVAVFQFTVSSVAGAASQVRLYMHMVQE